MPEPVLTPAPIQPPATWTFGDQAYTQGELSIEGEALLIGLVSQVLDALAKAAPDGNVPLGDLVDDDGNVNVNLAAKLVTTISSQIPDVAGQALAILFGHYPTDEDGQPEPEFPKVARRLARNVPSVKVVEVLQVFIRQNDYQRLAGPFGELAARFGIDLPAIQPAPEQASGASSDSPPPGTATPAKSSGGSRSARRSGTSTS